MGGLAVTLLELEGGNLHFIGAVFSNLLVRFLERIYCVLLEEASIDYNER